MSITATAVRAAKALSRTTSLCIACKQGIPAEIVNLTGGEPTRHPQLTEIVRLCHRAGIHRVTISTHGLTFLHDEQMLQELAELRARIVLSFDSFDDRINKMMIGANVFSAKMRV